MSRHNIPLANPSLEEVEINRVVEVLQSGWLVQGPENIVFEESLKNLHKSEYALTVSSGTAALHLIFLAFDIKKNDLVFIPSFTWPSAANVAEQCGAEVVLVDVDLATYNMSPKDLIQKIENAKNSGKNLKAVVAVHQFGLPADLDRISRICSENNLLLIEDAACALGATIDGKPVGNFGIGGILSFHPRKAITTGEGGAILTNNKQLMDQCRRLMDHGQLITPQKRDIVLPGLNYRLTNFQAALGNQQLKRFDQILSDRKRAVKKYTKLLSENNMIRLPAMPDNHTFQTFMVVIDDALDPSALINEMNQLGIGCGPGAIATHLMSYYADKYKLAPEDLPISNRLHKQGIALPLFYRITDEQISVVAEQLLNIVSEYANDK